MKIRVATAQYDIASLQRWGQYEAKITLWVERAVAQGAQLLLFPEYFSLELAALFGKESEGNLARQLAALQEALPNFLALFRQLAKTHQIYILAGTFPVRVAEGFRNRAHLLGPAGAMVFQDKLQITRLEAEQMRIRSGDSVKVFDTDFGKLGVNICYDIQFPLLARYQIEAGAQLLLVPSYADSLASYHRIRIGCQARALENQCYVIQATTVSCPQPSAIGKVRIGAAAAYAPPEQDFPDDGILAIGKINEPQWVFTDLDFQAIGKVRQTGETLNYQDWKAQKRWEGATLEQVKVIGKLRAYPS